MKHRLARVVGSGTVQEVAAPGGHINGDGSAAVLIEQKLDDEAARDTTRVAVYDVAARRAISDDEVPGRFIAARAMSQKEFCLWRSEADQKSTLMRGDPTQSMSVEIGQVDEPTTPSALKGSFLATEQGGVVSVTDLSTSVTVPLLAVDTGVRKWKPRGFTGDGRRLVVTDEPSETIAVLDATTVSGLPHRAPLPAGLDPGNPHPPSGSS